MTINEPNSPVDPDTGLPVEPDLDQPDPESNPVSDADATDEDAFDSREV